jgi:AraC-like DNA-binding protein
MLTKANKITSCYIGPQISPEQFIAEHSFLFLSKGAIHGYDGNRHYTLRSGECCLVRKNHLARYNKETENGDFEKVVVIFDEAFLKKFLKEHPFAKAAYHSESAFFLIGKSALIDNFVVSLSPYYSGFGKIDPVFADVKRTELLLILLQAHPALAAVLFDFGIPEKIDLEAFMSRNFRFNVSIQRFAYLTGRSLTSFKRDFERTFHEAPSRWLMRRRLEEAYFLMEKKGRRPSDVYIEVGFEDLSHFSYAFKKQFGFAPTKIFQANARK